MSPWNVLFLAFAAVSLLEGVLIVGILREVGGIYLQVGRPRAGATGGQGPTRGDTVESEVLPLTRPTILFFLSPTCSLCPPVAAAIPVAARNYGEIAFLPAVVGGGTEARLEYAQKFGDKARIDLDDLYKRWNVAGTPYAVGLTPDGTVRTAGIVNSLPQIESMAQTLVSVESHAPAHSRPIQVLEEA